MNYFNYIFGIINPEVEQVYDVVDNFDELNIVQEYILGWLTGRGFIITGDGDEQIISMTLRDVEEYYLFADLIKSPYLDSGLYTLEIEEKNMFKMILTHSSSYKLHIYDEKILNYLYCNINSKFYKRGYFEAFGNIDSSNLLICSIKNTFNTRKILEYYIENTQCFLNDDQFWVWEEFDALEFLVDLYDCIDRHNDNTICNLESNIYKIESAKFLKIDEIPNFIYYKMKPNAIAPKKSNVSNPGYEIQAIEKINEKDGIHYYSTGLKFVPEYGYYLEMHGNKLYTLGYMLASNFEIIDSKNTDELIIPLIKLNPDSPELELPVSVVNIVPKKINFIEFHELKK